jgi:hypothetical protein
MSNSGHQIFVDELARFAADAADGRVTAIAERVGAPMRMAVRGRRGVGCSTVARALRDAGADLVVAADREVDLVVYVTAEVLKPEDREAIGAARHPVLVVLNKADLVGFAGDGPIAAAQARCARLSALVAAPVQPMIGLLAVAALDGLDEDLWAALRLLASHPGSSASLDGSFDSFMAADNPVPGEVRLRLLETLDLFGTAVGVAAVRQGGTSAQVLYLLRRVSCVEAVVDKIAAIGAEVRYRRTLDAVAELEALAVGDEGISEFLTRDETVVARMASAVELARASGPAAGLEVGAREDPATHLSLAARWQRYSRGPVSDVHRACGADIARGSLRLWSRACESRESR